MLHQLRSCSDWPSPGQISAMGAAQHRVLRVLPIVVHKLLLVFHCGYCRSLSVLYRCFCRSLSVLHRGHCGFLSVLHRCFRRSLSVLHRGHCGSLSVLYRCFCSSLPCCFLGFQSSSAFLPMFWAHELHDTVQCFERQAHCEVLKWRRSFVWSTTHLPWSSLCSCRWH